MVKYDALPDIDSQPDVYETPDLDGETPHLDNYEVLSDYSSPEEESEEISRAGLSVPAAASRFAKATADTSEADFSGRVGKRRNKAVKGPRESANRRRLPDRDEYELGLGKDGESKFQRLRRLMFEVQELSEELNVDTSSAGDAEGMGEDGGAGQEQETRQQPSKTQLSHRQLLEQVSALQSELSRIGSSMGGPDALSSTFEAPAGTLTKQLETGKSLMAHLKAFKALSLSDQPDAVRSATPAPDNAPTTTTPTVTYELLYTPQTLKTTTLSKLTTLESRLTSLERLLGTSHLDPTDQTDTTTSLLQSSGSLIGALERLDHHLALLSQPRTLDALSRKVKNLTGEMERLAELRKKRELETSLQLEGRSSTVPSSLDGDPTSTSSPAQQITPDQDRKINRLFLTLDRVDPIASVVPHLLARLQGLRSLHAEAAVFSESLRMLVREQERIGEGAKVVEEALKSLEGSVRENEEGVKKNLASLEDRMKALGERVERLAGSSR
ncbi:hypothetical protein HDV00_009990 [Rhizophlyctis rosea]|nr:hypothetical protein HDV00_009990 [Rhizophlyctis rosea]